MALLTGWIDTSDFSAVYRINPHARIGVPLAEDNKNMVVHDPVRESFPFHGTVLAVHVIRWVSLLLAAVGIVFTYLIALTVFPGRRLLAVSATALHAFNPMFIFISASVNNDTLSIMLSSVAFYLSLRLLQPGAARGWRLLLTLGAVLAAGALTKLSALTIVPIIGIILVKAAWRERDWRPLWHGALAVGGPLLLLAGWWYIRNLLLYGEPTGMAMMAEVAGRRSPDFNLLRLLREWQGFRYSFWAVFGGFTILTSQWVYTFFDVLSGCALLGLTIWFWRQRRHGPGWPIALMLLWIGITFVGLVRWTMMTPASQGRLMFPTISALSLLMALGLAELLKSEMGSPGLLLGAVLALIALIIPIRYIRPVYTPPPQVPIAQARSPAPSNPVYMVFGERLALAGYDLDRRTVDVGEKFHLTLYWQTLKTFDRDYSIFVHVYDSQGQLVAQRDTYPGGGRLTTRQLQPGTQLVERLEVPVTRVPGGAPVTRVHIGLCDYPAQECLSMTDERGAPIDNLPLTRIKIGKSTVSPQLPPGSIPLLANFGDLIQLEGYRLESKALREGEPAYSPKWAIRITLYWRVLNPPDRDYTLFVHLIDGRGKVVSQSDHQPLGGDFPTSFWEPGEWVVDTFDLALGASMVGEDYRLKLGWYDPWPDGQDRLSNGQRLQLLDDQGQPLGDHILILWSSPVVPELNSGTDNPSS